jgi:hypothetical protein
MKALHVVGTGALVAALALVGAPAAHADGVAVTGGTVGQALYKSGTDNLFVKFIGKQASYTNDLYYYLTLPGTGEFLFRNNDVVGTEHEATTSAGLAIGSEAIFSICANVGSATPPGTGCNVGTQYFTGDQSRNPDTRFHATVWTRDAYLAGCALNPSRCNPDVTNLLSDTDYNIVVGFEDSFNYNIDDDFNDVVFAVKGATTTPEPVTMSLLATGLAGMGGAGVFKRRKKA